nr:hypothetical protein Q903MT_gene2883 [Picea sitchensis]
MLDTTGIFSSPPSTLSDSSVLDFFISGSWSFPPSSLFILFPSPSTSVAGLSSS